MIKEQKLKTVLRTFDKVAFTFGPWIFRAHKIDGNYRLSWTVFDSRKLDEEHIDQIDCKDEKEVIDKVLLALQRIKEGGGGAFTMDDIEFGEKYMGASEAMRKVMKNVGMYSPIMKKEER